MNSHPASMAAVAQLLGLRPPPVGRCRVLELGSGTGSNLLPLAEDLPDAELVGVDVSGRQVELSQQQAAALGLRNVRFVQLDLMDLRDQLGDFDYVIAHGLYTWVPLPVRERLLALCRERLTPDGLAYISYNTLPGWHFTSILRDLFLFHARDAAQDGPAQRIAAVEQMLRLLQDGIGQKSPNSAKVMQAYARQYQEHLSSLGPMRDSALHHDILADINQPVYLRDFAGAAERHGLQYVTEASLEISAFGELPDSAKELLSQHATSAVEMEQYLDFLQMRMFRQSLVCHAERQVDRGVSVGRMVGLHVGGRLRPAAARPDLETSLLERFLGPAGAAVNTNHPLSKAALCALSRARPRSIEFAALLAAARGLLGQDVQPGDADGTSDDAQEVGRLIFRVACQRNPMLRLRAAPSRAVAWDRGADRPVRARATARAQAQWTDAVTNAYHETVTLEPMIRWTLQRLDGARGRVALLDELCALAAEGKIRLPAESLPRGREPTDLRLALGGELDESLAVLSEEAVLV